MHLASYKIQHDKYVLQTRRKNNVKLQYKSLWHRYNDANVISLSQRHNCIYRSRYSLLFFLPQKELWEAYSNRTVRPSVPLRVRCISPMFFEVEIPNLVCGCILGWPSVAYHFRVAVTLTLTSDLVFIVITMSVRPSRFVSGAYLLYSLR